MIMKKLIFFTLVFLVLSMSLVTPVLAQGLFDKECPECHGAGKVTCDNCDGTGLVTCDRCDGSGTITATVQCSICQGTGEVEPTVTRKSMNGWGTLVGLDWVARVEGVFHNEEDVGTYGVARSEVHTVTTTYYHTSPRTYLTPHQDVTITIDTPEIEFLEDWTYTIYLYSADDISCPECNGVGAKSTITNCPDCNGIGTADCPNCNGLGTVTCPLCNGSGYVSDPTRLWIVAGFVIVVVTVIGVSAFALTRRKKAIPEVETKTT